MDDEELSHDEFDDDFDDEFDHDFDDDDDLIESDHNEDDDEDDDHEFEPEPEDEDVSDSRSDDELESSDTGSANAVNTNQQQPLIGKDLLKNLSITISAEAGQIILSLQQLVNLEVNQILDIASMPPKVNLLVNGVNIGNGYLVEINGRVGVRIAHLNSGINATS